MECRILKNKNYKITQNYTNNHQAIDLIGDNGLDYVVAHSDGKIIFYQDGYGNIKGSIGNKSYGNSVKIEHQNEYSTLYAHLEKGLKVKNNQYIKKGQIIGYISDSGNAYGKHLHFEVWKNNQRINPQEFLNKDFPNLNQTSKLNYKVGDIVETNGIYISSDSKEKLKPIITIGKITKINENKNNPYLLDDGKIGWANEKTIIKKITNERYLTNKTYQGKSIVDALKQINIDPSYNNRSELAKINNIKNYTGTANQNIKLLNLLKQGLLKF